MTRSFLVREAIALNDIADAPVGAQLVLKAAVSWQGEHPFQKVGEQFPVEPSRNSETEDAFSRKTRRPRQRDTVVVIPGKKIFLGRPVRINRVINDCGRAVDDLFAATDQPFSEFPIFACNGMVAAVWPQIEPEESMLSKHVFAESGVRAQRRDSDFFQLISQIEIGHGKLALHP